MPIQLFLQHDDSFDPEDIAKLSAAFGAALGKLGLTDRRDPLTVEVAKLVLRCDLMWGTKHSCWELVSWHGIGGGETRGERPCPNFSPKLTGSTTGYVGRLFPGPLKAKLILSVIGELRSPQSAKL